MANFNLNKVILGGRLTADPELKTTPTGISVTTFTIAVNRRFAKEGDPQQADFFNVTAWRQTAEFITRYFRKASSICVMGSIENRTWTDQQGQKHFATSIVADEAWFVDKKEEAPASLQQAQQAYQNPYAQPQAQQPYQNPYGTPAAPQPSYMPESYMQAPMGQQAPAPAPAPAPAQATAPLYDAISSDDELPF